MMLLADKRLWLVGMLCSMPVLLSASQRLKSLDIRVLLHDDGSAVITETRQMEVDDHGTECYITLGNMNGSRVSDLHVTDEMGLAFQTVQPWNIGASRSAKEHCAGIISKDNGYELCWGLGENGDRTYITTYTVSDLVRAYDDYDGFNYMFVADHLKPPAEQAAVRISRSGGFSSDDVRMWAFRYDGDINLYGGEVVAQTNGNLDSDQAMIVMLQFSKGVFHPARTEPGSFQEVKNRAFEGSDYKMSITDWLKEFASWVFALVVLLTVPVVWLWRIIRKWCARKRIMDDLCWWRDLPCNGNLQYANQVLNAYSFGKNDYKSLLSASVLRLISIGALDIRPDGIGILELRRERGLSNTRMLRDLYEIFRDAAGDDGVLQPKELKKWMKKNPERMQRFVVELREDRNWGNFKDEQERVRQVFGLRQFLKDFTLANERHATEVGLWKDYLVYVELFGIATQVRKDMQRLNPDFFQMDEQALQMTDRRQLPALMNITLNGVNINVNKLLREARRARGGGGSASSSGGGGYSGGGHGGGIR